MAFCITTLMYIVIHIAAVNARQGCLLHLNSGFYLPSLLLGSRWTAYTGRVHANSRRVPKHLNSLVVGACKEVDAAVQGSCPVRASGVRRPSICSRLGVQLFPLQLFGVQSPQVPKHGPLLGCTPIQVEHVTQYCQALQSPTPRPHQKLAQQQSTILCKIRVCAQTRASVNQVGPAMKAPFD